MILREIDSRVMATSQPGNGGDGSNEDLAVIESVPRVGLFLETHRLQFNVPVLQLTVLHHCFVIMIIEMDIGREVFLQCIPDSHSIITIRIEGESLFVSGATMSKLLRESLLGESPPHLIDISTEGHALAGCPIEEFEESSPSNEPISCFRVDSDRVFDMGFQQLEQGMCL